MTLLEQKMGNKTYFDGKKPNLVPSGHLFAIKIERGRILDRENLLE